MFGPEPDLTRLLWQMFPDHIPAVITVDSSRRLLMTRDFRAKLLAENQDASCWEAAVNAYARIQRSMEPSVDRLLRVESWDRHLNVLADQVDALLNDTGLMMIGHPIWGITLDQLAQLQVMAPRLKALCTELSAYRIPYTLVHGDFHAMNVAIRDGVPIFFDWSDGQIGHPFIDLISLFEEGDMLPKIASLKEKLRDIYLSHWADIESPDRLRNALELVAPLAMLNLAVTYRYIYYHQEEAAREELSGAVAYWFRKLLKTMAS